MCRSTYVFIAFLSLKTFGGNLAAKHLHACNRPETETMKAAAFLGFVLSSQAVSAFRLHCTSQSARHAFGVLGSHDNIVSDYDPDGLASRGADSSDPSSMITRQAFLAKTLVASSLPSLLGGIPSAFADEIAGVYGLRWLTTFVSSP
jgi:hypothetical protein